jgi:hypothetical protein
MPLHSLGKVRNQFKQHPAVDVAPFVGIRIPDARKSVLETRLVFPVVFIIALGSCNPFQVLVEPTVIFT